MFAQSTLLFTTLVLGALAGVSQAALTLKTPASMSMCDVVDLAPSGGVAPYTISVYKACGSSDDEDDDDKPMMEIKSMNNSRIAWTANIAEFQNIQLALTDSKGEVFYTDDMTVKTSKVGACVGKPAQFTYLDLLVAEPASSAVANSAPTTQIAAVPVPIATIGPIAPASGAGASGSTGQGVGAVGASAKNENGASSTAASFGLIGLVSLSAIFLGAW